MLTAMKSKSYFILTLLLLLFEGKILFQGTPEELAENKIVREKYLSNSFVLRRKDFQLNKDE